MKFISKGNLLYSNVASRKKKKKSLKLNPSMLKLVPGNLEVIH